MGAMRDYFRIYVGLCIVFLILLSIGVVGIGVDGESAVVIGFFTLGLTGISVMGIIGLGFVMFDCRHLLTPPNPDPVLLGVPFVAEPAVVIAPHLMQAVPPPGAAAPVHPVIEYSRTISVLMSPPLPIEHVAAELQEAKSVQYN